MAFVDELHIHVQAGKGGDGVVRWLHIRGKEFSGPAGGNGGRGGDVYVEGVRDLTALDRYVAHKSYAAQDGEEGRQKSQEGKNGEDLIFTFPVGSIITNTDNGMRYEVLQVGERIKLLTGGKGGYGNEHFKSSRNTSPQEATSGREGQAGHFDVELQLVVDAGFIGLPSAGKSSLVNALTKSRAKVGAYPFTTLEPHLGDLYGYILADIPGLIEGAADGKGLGHKFLRHIKRTKTLVHLVSLEYDDPVKEYRAIRKELGDYSEELLAKPELLVLSKTDLVDTGRVQEVQKMFKALSQKEKKFTNIFTVSVYDDESLKVFQDGLITFLNR